MMQSADTALLFVVVAMLAFICEYMDATLGMGYGTTLTPLLLILGFQPLQVVPAVLLAQLAGGFLGGVLHHKFRNIYLDFRRDSEICKRLRYLGYVPRSHDSKIVYVLAVCGVAGALIAVFFTLNIPQALLETYIGVMIMAVGIFMLRSRKHKFSWRKLVLIGLISSFNKGASGGGYGPLVTSGQILSGSSARNAVAATTVAEAIVCAVAFVAYLIAKGDIFWMLAVSTSLGSAAAAPLSVVTVRKISAEHLKNFVGFATILLGALIILKVICIDCVCIVKCQFE